MAAGRRRTRDRAGPASGRLAERCGRDAVAVLRRLLGDELAGAYLVGSGALGGFAPDQSDVDVVAVCAAPLPPDAKRALVDALGERAMTWPVRGLEFVLYARAAVARPAPAPRFEINLNVGRRMPYRASLDPTRDPAHWFVLDLAILRDHGRPLAGPPARDLVAPIPRPRLLAALRDSLAWHLAHESALHQSVLNACRGWRWTDEGIWSSKDDAAAWAHPRASDPDLVEAALAIRHGDPTPTLDPARVAAFQRSVLDRVERASETTPPAGPGRYTPGMEPRMYGEFAPWWPLLSAPSEYAEEAEIYRRLLVEAADPPPETVLELGSGGGNNASHLKAHFRLTLVDLSAGMLEVSRELNPGCEHVQGDMRTVRLGRTFDAVFVHDAVNYMTTTEDLRQVMETAFIHCRPGGAALFAPDHLRENFRTGTDYGGHDGDGRGARFLEWTWDPDPLDSSVTVDYAYLLRDADGSVRVEHDRHVEGLFPRATWLELLEETGFQARAVPVEHSELEPGTYELFVATRPHR